MNEVIKQQRIPCKVKQVYSKQCYGNPLFQDENFLNLKNIGHIRTNIFICNVDAWLMHINLCCPQFQ